MSFRESKQERPHSLGADIARIGALADATRARLYEFVAQAPGDVSRDDAAHGLGLTRRVAAFNLDALAEQGLLDVSFRRPAGRGGPGAGRPHKLYRKSGRRLEVSFPPRNYELLARVMASGAQAGQPRAGAADLSPGATAYGTALGAAARDKAGPRASRRALRRALFDHLTEEGFHPFVDDGGVIRLRNCPFHEMAQENRDLVCGLNLSLMRGVSGAIEDAALSPVLEPHDGTCCVAFYPARAASPS